MARRKTAVGFCWACGGRTAHGYVPLPWPKDPADGGTNDVWACLRCGAWSEPPGVCSVAALAVAFLAAVLAAAFLYPWPGGPR